MSVRLSSTVRIVLLLCSFGISHPLEATGDSNSEAALLQLEKTWLAAEDDPDALDSILADDFIRVLPVGFVTKIEQLSYICSHPSPKHETKRFENFVSAHLAALEW